MDMTLYNYCHWLMIIIQIKLSLTNRPTYNHKMLIITIITVLIVMLFDLHYNHIVFIITVVLFVLHYNHIVYIISITVLIVVLFDQGIIA